MKKNKALFLDRDGVINEPIIVNKKPFSPLKVKDFKFKKGIVKILKKYEKEFFLFIITNQPEISRGNLKTKTLKSINKKIKNKIKIKEILVCKHDQKHKCSFRKPGIGMILYLKNKYNLDVKNSILIGDRWKDILAGFKSGCKTIFLDYKYDEKRPTKYSFKINKIEEIEKIIKIIKHEKVKKNQN